MRVRKINRDRWESEDGRWVISLDRRPYRWFVYFDGDLLEREGHLTREEAVAWATRWQVLLVSGGGQAPPLDPGGQ